MRKVLNIVIIFVVSMALGVLSNSKITIKKLEKSTYFSGENVVLTENDPNIANITKEKRKPDTKLKNTMHFVSAVLIVLTIIFIVQNIRYKNVL